MAHKLLYWENKENFLKEVRKYSSKNELAKII